MTPLVALAVAAIGGFIGGVTVAGIAFLGLLYLAREDEYERAWLAGPEDRARRWGC